ncbi:MAG TPA: aminotransferase class I/II-fold pyridoxal phosphate-dependent enzyme [Gemmatimonadaceae bacterium]|nr:aminotransferase class I/II-fold pyridoxal phosphate-dependent enzyme [Gemmatimonadaceae bacterium]
MRIETLAVHAGRHIDPATRAVATPIHLSTTYERETDGSLPGGFLYSREGNPNRAALEECLAALEGGAAAAAFSSGSAATHAVLQALSPGDHVVAPRDAYYGTQNLLRTVFGPWGLEATFADMTDPAEVERAMRPTTRLVWVETPSNPLFTVTDIARVAEVAHAGGARCVCDNTFATPALQRPLELGADLVMHATTKYIGGQSDVLGGALVAREEDALFRRVRELQRAGGAVPSPFECWLLLRSVSTLPHRMRQHSASALAVASFLAEHPAVHAVYYPGLATHPGSDVAARQMRLPGGMLSFRVRGGREWALRVAAGVKLFTRATSLGGAESLIEHRATVEGPASRTPDDLLRCSIGLEHPDDLIDDLRQSLDRRD